MKNTILQSTKCTKYTELYFCHVLCTFDCINFSVCISTPRAGQALPGWILPPLPCAASLLAPVAQLFALLAPVAQLFAPVVHFSLTWLASGSAH